MTVKQVYEDLLIELNKAEAPTLLLGDFVYFVNKAITNYFNKRYNLYEITQQITDDLRVLSGQYKLTSLTLIPDSVYSASYAGVLPQDYWHILNCSVKLEKTAGKCPTSNKIVFKGSKKMTSEMYSGIIDNYYNKPSFKNSFYYLRNTDVPQIDTNGIRQRGDRDGNASPVRIEIIYGDDKDIAAYTLKGVYGDYLRVPQYVTITEEEIDEDEDTSQVLEFPDQICKEIVKELVALLMENSSDPRLNTNIPMNVTSSNQPPRNSR